MAPAPIMEFVKLNTAPLKMVDPPWESVAAERNGAVQRTSKIQESNSW
jgi:hypothetical protein